MSVGCDHRWETIEKREEYKYFDNYTRILISGREGCLECGLIRSFKEAKEVSVGGGVSPIWKEFVIKEEK